MTRAKLWSFDQVVVDFEDLDVSVRAVHGPSLTEVHIRFRAERRQIEGDTGTLRTRLECLAADTIQNLASFLDRPD